MRPISNFDIYIFDCDGVILNSNQLKIDAMRNVLSDFFDNNDEIDNCVSYFTNNFGKSRFHHVDVFLSKYLSISNDNIEIIREAILNAYSIMCKKLYLKADITPGFLDFLRGLHGRKFIASGSEQEELRYIFNQRKLDHLFDGIYGSPIAKSDNINTILKNQHNVNAVMFGDAISDLNAALDNNIEFFAYLPFSNVAPRLKSLSIEHKFDFYNSWSEIN
jgi:phosphoglycolate phosphatase-like HAD superfamily hydrolase